MGLTGSMGPTGQRTRLLSRREFLRNTAAAGAVLAAGAPLASACTTPPPAGSDIVSAAIHPAVGVARVGNSPDLFFFGPELPRSLPRSPNGFKDAAGALARQAARFRVYGLDAQGRYVRELSPTEAGITWTVDVANKKAAWYKFNTAMDIPVAKAVTRRNPSVRGDDRRRLVVSSTGKRVSGAAASPVALDGGRFLDVPVDLGEILTDERGRLVVMPGDGRGYSPNDAPLGSFSDNDNWTDNTCDGLVRATVNIGGRVIDAQPAWLLVTPPNYGPAISTGLVTLYDSVASGLADAQRFDPGSLSFERDILSLFTRMVDMQWVNAGYLATNGWGSPADWLATDQANRLADSSPGNKAWRTDLVGRFRSPDYGSRQPDDLPAMYGDGVDIPAANNYQWLAVTPLQHRRLEAWGRGEFTDDRGKSPFPDQVESLPVDQQPAALDRAALESCLGGAYHPGIEAPWTMRVPSMWNAPFRLKVSGTEVSARDYGDSLTPTVAMGETGPVHGVTPGDLTQWMGVPWHSDAGSCRSGYERQISLVSPTFWPARIPNQVLSEADYQIVLDTSRPIEERQAAFARRRDWQRHITSRQSSQTLAAMTKDWAKLGVVTDRPGPSDGRFPSTMKVETALGFSGEPAESIAADGRPYP